MLTVRDVAWFVGGIVATLFSQIVFPYLRTVCFSRKVRRDDREETLLREAYPLTNDLCSFVEKYHDQEDKHGNRRKLCDAWMKLNRFREKHGSDIEFFVDDIKRALDIARTITKDKTATVRLDKEKQDELRGIVRHLDELKRG